MKIQYVCCAVCLTITAGCATPCVDDGWNQEGCSDRTGLSGGGATDSDSGASDTETETAAASDSASGQNDGHSGTSAADSSASTGQGGSASASDTDDASASDSYTDGASASESDGDDGGMNVPVEVCDGIDNDGDGAIDEVSAANALCNGCELEQFGMHAYYFCGDLVTWFDARDTCEGFGATLSSVVSEAENTFIAAHVVGDEATELWIGHSDLLVEGAWVWEDGEPFAYQNWAAGEPNDHGDQDCGQLYDGGVWDDDHCTEMRTFVCKVPHTL